MMYAIPSANAYTETISLVKIIIIPIICVYYIVNVFLQLLAIPIIESSINIIFSDFAARYNLEIRVTGYHFISL
jgi:hypothetical protein